MRITALGASSGIGRGAYTTSFLIDDHTLIDCGTGVGTLDIRTLVGIERVLLTHSHLDHAGLLPMLADAHASHDGPGVTAYTQRETAEALTARMFDGQLWPDYTRYPSEENPYLRFRYVEVGDTVPLPGAVATALPAAHTVPCVGWLVETPKRALAFTGDTGPCPAFWQKLATVPALSDVITEVSYRNAQSDLGSRFGHMTSNLLAPLVELLPTSVHLWISHLEPGSEDVLMAEVLATLPPTREVTRLVPDQVIEL